MCASQLLGALTRGEIGRWCAAWHGIRATLASFQRRAIRDQSRSLGRFSTSWRSLPSRYVSPSSMLYTRSTMPGSLVIFGSTAIFVSMQPILLYLLSIRFLSASRTAWRNGRPECSSRSSFSTAVLSLWFPSMITLRTENCGPSLITKVRSRLAEMLPGLGLRRHLGLEETLRLIVFDELVTVTIEHLAVILAEESRNRLPGRDVRPEGGRRGEPVADEVDAADLDLGSLEDLDHDLGVAGLAPFEQLDLGQEVALLLVESEDVSHRQPGVHGIGAVLDLQSGRVLELFQSDGFPASELDVGQDGHLVDGEGQDELAALGRGLLVEDLDVGEPLGVHQRLDIGVDLLHIERLADPAQEF